MLLWKVTVSLSVVMEVTVYLEVAIEVDSFFMGCCYGIDSLFRGCYEK
jgi:hypothetical protein